MDNGEALLAGIKKMHFGPGDVMVITDQRVLACLSMAPPLGMDIPVIVDIGGNGFSKLTREDLVRLLESN